MLKGQNKKQEQRIILFVGSPVKATEKELASLGSQLKKNKVAIDIVSFGEDNAEANQAKLDALHKAANNNDNCHIVTIPPGTHMLSEQLQRTPIVRGENAGSDTGMGENFVDDNIDPELAEALRLSMLQAEQDNKNREQKDGGSSGTTVSNKPAVNVNAEEDPELAEALRLSMMGHEDGGMAVEGEEEDELAMAIRLSRETAVQDRENDEKELNEKKEKSTDMVVEEKKTTEPTIQEAVDMSAVDPEYMSSLFLELPGIDPNDPEVQALLSKMKEDKKEEKKD